MAGASGKTINLRAYEVPPLPFRSDPSARVLFVTAEAFPLAKTGGLADVASALPAELQRLGADVWTMLPGYEQALDLTSDLSVVEGCPLPEGRLLKGLMPDTNVPVILFDAPDLFRRKGLYLDEWGRAWSDNDQRFAIFCRAACEVALGNASLGWRPEIVHANDWHTGLLPAYLHFSGQPRPRTVFTIHNLAFQGNYPMSSFPSLGLPPEAWAQEGVEFHGQVSFIKSGIVFSDKITTVSPNYAQEIQTPEFGCGLDGLLRARSSDLSGILNGVDYNVWDPAKDAALVRQFSDDDPSGKQECKRALLRQMNLPIDMDVPVIACVNRLTHQKMADVMLDALPHLVDQGAVIVIVHGQGDRSFEAQFLSAANDHARNVAVRIGYDELLAHQVMAGADMFLSLARFEPCGLTVMYAMLYGAIPIANRIGGLVDSIEEADDSRADPGHGTGFMCDGPGFDSVNRAVASALSFYRDRDAWARLRQRAMRKDFRWNDSARSYADLYTCLVE